VDAHGNPVRAIVTAGPRADCTQAYALIGSLRAQFLIADKGYDAQTVLDAAAKEGMTPVIPPRKCRKDQREFDHHLYKMRHLVENAFLRLKEWRGVATRYAKNTASFLAAVQIRCLFHWLSIS
jgi:transposase